MQHSRDLQKQKNRLVAMAAKAADDDDAIWVPVTLHLPLGVTKSFGLDNCAVCSLLVGPFSIIMLAQTANTVLVPVLPFLVKDVGASAVSYGMLQSTMWTSQTILAPILGWFSDRYGQKPVILLSLLFSAAGFALLAVARTISVMMVARTISGLGFQVALFRAYFADAAPKKERTGRFGLIGVITSFSLFAGPSIGGLVARVAGRASAAWLSTLLCLVAAAVCLAWQPDEEAAKRCARRATRSRLARVRAARVMRSLHGRGLVATSRPAPYSGTPPPMPSLLRPDAHAQVTAAALPVVRNERCRAGPTQGDPQDRRRRPARQD
jgi:MFS family permease